VAYAVKLTIKLPNCSSYHKSAVFSCCHCCHAVAYSSSQRQHHLRVSDASGQWHQYCWVEAICSHLSGYFLVFYFSWVRQSSICRLFVFLKRPLAIMAASNMNLLQKQLH